MKTTVLGWSLLVTLSQFSAFPFANAEAPVTVPGNLHCLSTTHESLGYNNSQVMKWKVSTKDQYLDRGYVNGTIANLLPDHTGHTHFSVNIDNIPGGDIEVIYNDEFGELPNLSVGMTVIACGDYITVGKNAHLPSPYGAIIHWVHNNPGTRDGGKHPSGFLIINGKPYGMGTPAN